MPRLRVATIVEGHGEVAALPILLDRIWCELLERKDLLEIQRPPIREKRDRLALNKDDALGRAVELAVRKLRAASNEAERELILVLLDADRDLPCVLGPRLGNAASQARRDFEVACVIANVEYETWIIAGASTLGDYLNLSGGIPMEPEQKRLGKRWIQDRFKGAKYSETVDQPKLTSKFDLRECRRNSPSFDKLCREIEKRL